MAKANENLMNSMPMLFTVPMDSLYIITYILFLWH